MKIISSQQWKEYQELKSNIQFIDSDNAEELKKSIDQMNKDFMSQHNERTHQLQKDNDYLSAINEELVDRLADALLKIEQLVLMVPRLSKVKKRASKK